MDGDLKYKEHDNIETSPFRGLTGNLRRAAVDDMYLKDPDKTLDYFDKHGEKLLAVLIHLGHADFCGVKHSFSGTLYTSSASDPTN